MSVAESPSSGMGGLCLMNGGPGKMELEGQKVLGPSMTIRRQTATMSAQ